jgi:hypothetical protein
VSVRRQGYAARLIKPLLGVLAMAAGVGVAVAFAATGSSTQLGGTSTTFAVSVNEPFVQVSTTPGTSPYATPDGVLTSWRYHSIPSPAPTLTLRLTLFKPGDAPHVYQAMAASDTKNIDSNTGYDFKERIPVKQGYVLGVVQNSVGNIGLSPVSGSDLMGGFPADVQVGDTATATDIRSARLAVAATVESDKDGDGFGDVSQDKCPTQKATQDACSNKFDFGRLKHNRNNGTARFPVTVPGAGTLTLSGKGIVGQRLAKRAATPAARSVSAAGTVKLLIKAKGKAKRKLNDDGKVKIKVRVTYTPTDGTPSTKKPKVKLIKKLQP